MKKGRFVSTALTRNGARFWTERGKCTSTVKARSSVGHRPAGVCVTNSLVLPSQTMNGRRTRIAMLLWLAAGCSKQMFVIRNASFE